LALAAIGALVTASASAEQASPREVLLGTAGPAASRGRGAPVPAPATLRDEREARALYEDARDDLAQGQQAAGQRLLEVLIARYPLSEWAARARHDIVAIYSAQPARRTVPLETQRSTLGAGRRSEPAPPGARAASPVATEVASPPISAAVAQDAWSTQVRPVARPVQDEFRFAAGDRVFFSDSSADLGSRARGVLAAQATWLKRNPAAVVRVEGHADEPGTAADNVAIAQRRADAVRRRLVEEGVETSRISVMAYGRDQRIAPCVEPECAAQNRRAVTVVAGARQADGITLPPLRTAR